MLLFAPSRVAAQVIPATTNSQTEAILVAAKHRSCVLRLKQELVDGQLRPVALAGRALSVLAILARVGVPLLDTRFARPPLLVKLDGCFAQVLAPRSLDSAHAHEHAQLSEPRSSSHSVKVRVLVGS
jgi:hypothetical protein